MLASNNGYAWTFRMSNGEQYNYLTSSNLYAWAVRDGDVAAVVSTVPVPAAA